MNYLYWFFILCVFGIVAHSRGSPSKIIHSTRVFFQVVYTAFSIARTILIMMWIRFRGSHFARSLRSKCRSLIFRSPAGMTDEKHTTNENVARKPLRRPRPKSGGERNLPPTMTTAVKAADEQNSLVGTVSPLKKRTNFSADLESE